MLLTLFPVTAGARSDKDKQRSNKKTVVKESKQKDAVIDSLQQVIETYTLRLEELGDHEVIHERFRYENKSGIGSGLKPEDYTPEVTDSLLSFWYLLNRTRNNHEDEKYDMETVSFSSDVSDKEFKKRLEKINSCISLPYNETVRNYIIRYADKMPVKMGQMLGLAKYYMPIFEEILHKYGLPEELKYMAVIESALNPTAISKAGAGGMWQFMRTTGRSYGLQIDSYVDERFDVEKAADAAARYLKDAYGIFGDWNLAISSYNCGPGNVNKAIKRCGGNTDYWNIYAYLPRETRGYVPAFVGAMYAFTYYKEHGIVPEECTLPAHVDTFHVNKNIHFKQISEVVGVPMELLKDLNPQYFREIIPGNEKTYVLRLPYEYTSRYIEYEDSVYKYKKDEIFNPAILDNTTSGYTVTESRIVYKVRKGDVLGRIANKYHVTVADIRKWNNLRSNNIRIGQNLVIYQKVTVPKKVEPEKKPEPAIQPADTVKASAAGTGGVAGTEGGAGAAGAGGVAGTEGGAGASGAAVAGGAAGAAGSTGAAGASGAASAANSGGAAAADSTQSNSADSTKTADSAAGAGSGDASTNSGSSTSSGSSANAGGSTNADNSSESEKKPEYIIYTVKAGDTLFGISKKYPGVTVSEIKKLNGIGDKILVGSKLKIPVK